MRHLKTVMIVTVLLMISGFSISVLFGMWCIYEEDSLVLVASCANRGEHFEQFLVS